MMGVHGWMVITKRWLRATAGRWGVGSTRWRPLRRVAAQWGCCDVGDNPVVSAGDSVNVPADCVPFHCGGAGGVRPLYWATASVFWSGVASAFGLSWR